jgi:hypothetical protein
MTQTLEFKITIDHSTKVSIDQFDDGVWLHILTRNGTMYTTMTIEHAKEMIEALTRIVEAQ